MKIKRFIKIVLGIFVICLVLVLTYKVYRYHHRYLLTIGEFQNTEEGPVIIAHKGDYFSYGGYTFRLHLRPKDKTMFDKLKSGDIIYLAHSDISSFWEADKDIAVPFYYVKINKWMYKRLF